MESHLCSDFCSDSTDGLSQHSQLTAEVSYWKWVHGDLCIMFNLVRFSVVVLNLFL